MLHSRSWILDSSRDAVRPYARKLLRQSCISSSFGLRHSSFELRHSIPMLPCSTLFAFGVWRSMFDVPCLLRFFLLRRPRARLSGSPATVRRGRDAVFYLKLTT